MLQLIREEEERHEWTVPEPVRCVYCGHFSPIDGDGLCPVKVHSKLLKHPLKCLCLTHELGLKTAKKRELNKILGMKPDEQFTISPAEASSEALNG